MFLLAFWQVCKLKREQADFQNKRMKNDRELDRCTKSIDKHQKYYTAEIQRVKDEAKNATNVFEQQIRYNMGLSTQGLNPWNFGNYGGMSGFVYKQVNDWIQGGAKGPDGKQIEGITQDRMNAIWKEHLQGGQFRQGNDGQYTIGGTLGADGNVTGGITVTPKERDAFMQVLNSAYNMQSCQQQEMARIQGQFSQGASIWQEARIEELEAKQDAMLEPLQYKQIMLEQDNTYIETSLDRIKNKLESYNKMLSEGTQESVAKFGLS